ncbi:MAG: hypothetical protein ACFFBD_06225 [Candidatus Hodarchaeota archaeon]
MLIPKRLLNFVQTQEEGILPFLFGTRERIFFSLWYIIVLSISMLYHTFGDEQWRPLFGDELYDILFMILIVGVLGGSTGYWLFMSIFSFFRSSKD